ncbi:MULTISPECIES: relaxase/mobilization nuclease domain-containing protein [Sphingobium]|uniref:relaxase/mobilization nuclease domain-containing protein n=1 Tax=Sphingobium sp. MI1205 TaxID=407020 RepID=UPI00076FFD3C|nr:VirD2 family relaxase/mobilization nuclease [Sphingobium sp. MI1205]AMK18288.1 Type IV secretory pathway VirD2 components (relaxase)-like protein [Sphingobium sp. MI1205]
MTGEENFRIRPGRVRSRGGQRALRAIAQALAAAQRAGGHISRRGRIIAPGRSTFGRGRSASVRATHRLGHRSRQVIVKARVVRHGGRASLAAHLNYLQRDGVTRDGERGVLFGAEADNLDRNDFASLCKDDRHHFRFIVSPEDAADMGDLKGFTRELMRRMETDLGTRLDWRAVEHWNTDNPHVHIIVRGVAEDGQNLVISRDYIREGMRAQARDIVTRELGLRTDLEVRQSLERQVEAERWTEIDRDLSRTMQRDGVIDMAPEAGTRPDADHALRMGRLRKLERLGLASEVAPGQWTLAGDAQAALRELGERDDIIKRMHKAMTERGIDRGAASYVLEPDPAQPVIGKLVDRGLHDELTGHAYAIVDGIDGRTHHVQFPDIEATGDCRPGAIVELRRFTDRKGRDRVALAVRSDMDLDAQVRAPGATWLDRRNLSSDGRDLGGGFGTEVRAAMEARAEHLAGEGLAHRQGQRIVFARNLLDTLRRRELDATANELSAEIGLPHTPSKSGEYVAGAVRQRLTLASGRFAMIDNGLGFQLVPWSPSLDSQIGKHISGVMRGDGSVDWSFGRGRGLGL